ncbi:hypothetical protein J9303_01040 [Bacillaceae bacterium Marseille-Q3522]|nr:hypothetical protein [Bacillaceae bacterium Marseille-Q3522]
MKHGKRPTRHQKRNILSIGLNPNNWLVAKNLTDVLYLEHRETGRIKIIPKWK